MIIIQQWIFFILIVQVIHFLGTWKLYKNAGRNPLEALIPVYNAVILMRIIKRPFWWVILLFIPIVNLIMFATIWVETARSFGKKNNIYGFLSVITCGFYLFYINYATSAVYDKTRLLSPKTSIGQWTSSILFAIVTATIIHTYVIQPFQIPTSSLEKSLLIGDFLFVSKYHYGARVPKTVLSVPMVHDTVPVLKTKSYLNKPQLPTLRLPGFQEVKRNDIVVFNWPVDTVQRFFDKSGLRFDKPLDKKSNYVKRCVGIPGDTLSVVDGYVYINDKKTVLPKSARIQFFYNVYTNGKSLNPSLLDKYDITEGGLMNSKEGYVLNLTQDAFYKLESDPNVNSIERSKVEFKGIYDPKIFPHNPIYPFNNNYLGPIYIPQKGKTIELNDYTIPLYKEIIEDYEHNDLIVNGEDIYINGKKEQDYTFKQSYYWMMGDNRDNSEDSRTWGFVPQDHILGKPVMIFLSIDKNKGPFAFRWNRMFSLVNTDSKTPKSYLALVLFIALGYALYSFFKSHNKKNNRHN